MRTNFLYVLYITYIFFLISYSILCHQSHKIETQKGKTAADVALVEKIQQLLGGGGGGGGDSPKKTQQQQQSHSPNPSGAYNPNSKTPH